MIAEIGFRDPASTLAAAVAPTVGQRGLVVGGAVRSRGRDLSPDSVIFTPESNLSLFSSASVSVDRCSFASDGHDRDSVSSDYFQHLAGHESGSGGGRGSLRGPDPSLSHSNKLTVFHCANSYDHFPCKKAEKASKGTAHSSRRNSSTLLLLAKVFQDVEKKEKERKKVNSAFAKFFKIFHTEASAFESIRHFFIHALLICSLSSFCNNICLQKQEDSNNGLPIDDGCDGNDDAVLALDAARNSFSLALRECQERRTRSEALTRKLERRRPASLDLNNSIPNVVSFSPRFGTMNKNAISSRKSGNFPSPGTPNYRHGSVGINKGWHSERVPLPTVAANRRQVGGSTLLPYNHNGRTLPSKWEDAERWIFSPVGGDGSMRTSHQHHLLKRPKSKSGPLGPPGLAYYSIYSPTVPTYDGNIVNNFNAASSPFSAGVMMADGLAARYGGRDGVFADRSGDPAIARCASVHGCTDLIGQPAKTSSHGETFEPEKDVIYKEGRAVSRRDMATQMSPDDSCDSPPKRRSSLSWSTPSILPIVEVRKSNPSKSEVRDVQVDERVTVSRWSMKHKSQSSSKGLDDVDDWKLKAFEARSSTWDASNSSRSLARAKREDARITAWENLQKAKAEAAIRKLEMKLEKKRSSSMDKIMNKLKSAQKKAQEMRSSVAANQPNQLSKTSSFKSLSFRRTRQVGSMSGCFTCPAF